MRTDGHNTFLYGHPTRRGDPQDVDFGVEVVRTRDRKFEFKKLSPEDNTVASHSFHSDVVRCFALEILWARSPSG